ncbi:MAG: DUF721 domain-containing protein [Planctomycetota bacterium]|jgi:hypothetical protein|nr:DUF721 domain-containing protein [Planctomycetota bacterium]
MSSKKRYCKQAVPIGSIVNDVLGTYGVSRGVEHKLVFEVWDAIVPLEFKDKCRAVYFRNGKLIIEVKSSPLLQELRCFRQSEFVSLINQEIQRGYSNQNLIVKKIEFKTN